MIPNIAQESELITLPVSKKEIEIRPFLVKEQKILLKTDETDISAVTESVKKIISACILTEGIDIEELPPVDIEYLFIRLRIISVGETIQLKYKENCCGEDGIPLEIDLREVIVVNPEISQNIKLTKDVGVKMRIPTPQMISSVKGKDVDAIIGLITKCIHSIYTDTEVYSNTSEEEIEEWVLNLNKTQLEKISDFFKSLPHLKYTKTFVCAKCNKDITINLKDIQDFFI